MAGETLECRICLESDLARNLIAPCDCDGSVRWTHPDCLRKWAVETRRTQCEICHGNYRGLGADEVVLDVHMANIADRAAEAEDLFSDHMLRERFFRGRTDDVFHEQEALYNRSRSSLGVMLIIVFLMFVVTTRPRHEMQAIRRNALMQRLARARRANATNATAVQIGSAAGPWPGGSGASDEYGHPAHPVQLRDPFGDSALDAELNGESVSLRAAKQRFADEFGEPVNGSGLDGAIVPRHAARPHAELDDPRLAALTPAQQRAWRQRYIHDYYARRRPADVIWEALMRGFFIVLMLRLILIRARQLREGQAGMHFDYDGVDFADRMFNNHHEPMVVRHFNANRRAGAYILV